MDKDMKYSLLEILENPKRLNSLSPLAVYEYARIAAEGKSEERFYSYIKIISKFQTWCITGLMFACSDIFPLKILFKEGIENAKLHEYQQGSLSLNQVFQQFVENLQKGRFNIESNRTNFVKKMEANLAKDDLRVFIDTLSQAGFTNIQNKFKSLYERGLLDDSLAQWFSFAYKDLGFVKKKGTDITGPYIATNTLKRLYRVYDFYFEETKAGLQEYSPKKDLLRTIIQCMRYVRPQENIPDTGVLYVDENDIPLLQSTPSDFYSLVKPKDARVSNSIPEYIADGAKYIIGLGTQYKVETVCSFENGMLSKETVKVDHVKPISFPYLDKTINMIFVEGEVAKTKKEFVVYAPNNTKIEIPTGKNHDFIKWNQNYILTK